MVKMVFVCLCSWFKIRRSDVGVVIIFFFWEFVFWLCSFELSKCKGDFFVGGFLSVVKLESSVCVVFVSEVIIWV